MNFFNRLLGAGWCVRSLFFVQLSPPLKGHGPGLKCLSHINPREVLEKVSAPEPEIEREGR